MSDALRWADHRVFPAGERGGGPILFGAEHASLFRLEPAVERVLGRWRTCEVVTLDDAPVHEREVLEALRDARVLVPVGNAARPTALRPDPAHVPLSTLVLEVAQACNLRCTYCYAGGGSYGGEARLMTPELARRAVRYLFQASGTRERVALVLFGGEPLMNMPAIEAAVLEGEACANATGKSVGVSLTSNGTRFTAQAIDFLTAHGVGITVSIDGPPEVHDANRRYRGAGGGTYADVLAGVAALRARGGRPPAARVTLTPAQWSRIPEIYEHLAGLGFLEVGIAPASPTTAALLPTPEQEDALLASFASLGERFVAEAQHGRVLPFSNLLDLLARLHVGRVKFAPCGAGLGYLALDAQGRFFLCHRLAGAEAFEVGDLEHGIAHAKIASCLADQARPRAEDCARCWARSVCAGGCHHDNHVREHDLGLPHGGSCDFVRRWIELGIRVYAVVREADARPVLAFLERRAD